MAETATLAHLDGLHEVRQSPASHLTTAFEKGSVPGTVDLKEIPFQTMAAIRVVPGTATADRIASVTGGLPSHCGQVGGSDAVDVLWVGPTEFLVIGTETAHDSLGGDVVRSLTEALGDGEGQVVDLSANRTTFELSGARARDVLEKGCALDLHPRAFKAGTAMATEIGHIPTMLQKTGEDRFRIFPRASFADFLGRWLLDAMREFAFPPIS